MKKIWNFFGCMALLCAGQTVAFAQEYTLTGSIRDASGNGIGGQIAILDPATGNQVAEVFVDGTGNGTTGLIPAGQYVAYAGRRFGQEGFIEERWDGGEPTNLACPNLSCDLLGGTLIDLTGGNVAGIDFVLDPVAGGGRLSGNVVYPDGVTPVVGVSMSVISAAGYEVQPITTDRFGNFSTPLLGDGEVYLRVDNDAPDGLAPELWNGGEPGNTVCVPYSLCFDPVANGAPITIAGGDVGALDFQLEIPAGGQVIGSFEDLDFGFALADMNVELLDTNGGYVTNVPTDATGTYTFAGLADGDYKVFISGPSEGYPQFLIGDGSCSIGCDPVNSGALFTVTGGNVASVGATQVAYEGGPRITGLINRSDTGEPVSSRAGFAGASLYDPAGNYIGGGPTDRSGRYQLVPGVAGDYVVETTNDQAVHNLINEIFDNVPCAPGCDPNDPARTLVTVPSTAPLTAIADFALDAGRSISGTITATADGAPIQGITVCAEPEPAPDFETSICADTDAGGGYTIVGLPSRSDYVVWTNQNGLPFIPEVWNDRPNADFSQGDLVDVTAGDVTGIDFALGDTASIRGTITASADGLPIEGVTVDFFDPSCNFVTSVQTDAAGQYLAPIFGDGEYYVHARANFLGFVPELFPDLQRLSACNTDPVTDGAPISIAGAQTVTGIDFQLDVGASISGFVSDASGVLPQFGAQARLYLTDGTQLLAGFNNQPDNSYLLQGLPAGDYNVVLSGGPGTSGLVDERWDDVPCPRNSCPLGTGNVITLAPGEARTGIDAVLDSGSVISGQLTDQQGNPLPNSQIAIYNDLGLYAAFAVSDANGNYTTRNGLPAGDYRISNQFDINGPQPVPAGFIPTVYPDRACGDPCDFLLGDPITVDGVNPATGIDMVWQSTRTISGTLRAEDTLSPIANATVCLGIQSEANLGFQQCQVTDASGQFALGGLGAVADYVVAVDDFAGQPFFPEIYDNFECCDLTQGTPIDTFPGNQNITFDVARSATISGTILDNGTLSPIEGVPVDLLDASCNLIGTGVTDGSGNYTISGFAGGTYYVHAFARFVNYIGELYPDLKRVQACFPDPVTDGAPITVVGTQAIGSIDFRLDQGAAISGFVSDANGVLPQFSAQARLYATDGTQLFVGFNDQSDNSYRLQGLPAGDYNVVLSGAGQTQGLVDEIYDDIQCPRNSCPPGTGVTISLAPGELRSGISATLDLGSQISGRLTDAAGNPLASALVAIYNDVGEYAGFAVSDANGDYTTRNGFPAGEYLVSNQFAINEPTPVAGGFLPVVWPGRTCGEPCNFLLGDPVTLDGVNPVTGIDLVFQTGSSIAGTVSGDATPASGVQVRLLDASNGGLIRTAATAADGTYSFEGIGAGDYLLRTLNSIGLSDQLYAGISCNPFCDPLSGTVVNLPPDTDLPGIDFGLTSTPRIVGTVFDDLGGPVGGVKVDAYNSLGARVASATSAPDGSFEIGNLFAGTFFVRTANTFGFVDALADGLFCPAGCNPVLEGTPIGVGSSGSFPAGGLDLTLGDASSLVGQVTNGASALAAVRVEVYTPTGQLAASQITGDDGRYAIEGLAAGSYHVVTRNGQGFIDESATGTACPSSCAPTTTAPIELLVSQQLEIDFALSQGGSISGRVTNALGGALPSVEVKVFTDSGVEVSAAITDASGNYRIGALLPADYVARTTSNPYGLRNRLYDDRACDADCSVTGGTLISLTSGASANGIDFVLPDGKSISGSITDALGDPIGGIRVAAFDASGVQAASAVTGSGGLFSITGLPDGVFQLRTFNALNFIDQAIGGDECTPRLCALSLATSFDVQAQSQTGAGAALRSGQFLTGTATDDSGNPIFSGSAQLYSDQAELLKTTPINQGTFTFSGLAGGTYYAVVTNDLGLVDQAWTGPGQQGLDCPGGSCLSCLTSSSCEAPPAGPAPIVLADPVRGAVGGSDLSFRLPAGERLQGSVLDAQGSPLPGVEVFFFNDSGADAGAATTNGLGNFQSDSAFGAGIWFAATRKSGESGVIGFIDELFDNIPCETGCSVTDGDAFSTPSAPSIEFELNRQPTERIFGSSFEF